ncbi:PTS system, fructose-specific IIA component [Gilliamella bombicola]|uniref:PTS system, fructose-specific IIA component n=1 Tax=Gilliamella bombicola TaxID=1798182 RepID=A0A1C4ABJ4_9GAMM|nr:PTS sugar transporter subunit IIA [Gilliamella bombicola]SCB91841.1 PTS system, fructose-specific IIA component [Gilliamella bombicola]
MQSIPVLPVDLTGDVVTQKSSVIHLMVETSQAYLTNIKTFFDDVMAHEQEMETDVLPDIALPHAKSSAVKTPFIVVGKYSDGIIWNNDNKVKLIVMIGAPEHANKEHLSIIAKLASNLANDDFVEDLLKSDIQSVANKIRGLYE